METKRFSEYGNECIIYYVLVELETGSWSQLSKATGYFDRGWEHDGVFTYQAIVEKFPDQFGLADKQFSVRDCFKDNLYNKTLIIEGVSLEEGKICYKLRAENFEYTDLSEETILKGIESGSLTQL